jgi:hypothetical protein
MLRRIALFCALAVSAIAQPAARTDSAGDVCDETASLSREVAAISGMSLKHSVPCQRISRAEVNEYIQKRIKESAKPEDIHAEEVVLKRFGLVPRDFDLAKATVELLTEQAAAFYDYEKKKLFITDSTPSAMQSAILAHELSHAVADQNFNLGKYIRKGNDTDDGSTARLAVMEGQATWVMSEYMARLAGSSLRTNPELAAMMSAMQDSAGEQFPVFDKAPLYFRLSLIFPYTKGVLFQNALVQKLGDGAFAEPFRKPPVSTQQILHPEKYISGFEPTHPALPKTELPGYKRIAEGSLGEFDNAALIEQFSGKAAAGELAPHWRGSSLEVRENKKANRAVVLYSAEWDSEDAARKYFEFYKSAIRKKSASVNVGSETADSFSGTDDDGRFELRRAGAIVSSVEGLAPRLD